MSPPVVLLSPSGSRLPTVLETHLASRGAELRTLILEGPTAAKITIGTRAVRWDGVDLLSAGALFVERPEFPWPQTSSLEDFPAAPAEQQARIAAEREARSLRLSALFAAAEIVPVVNPPESCHLVASPAAALDRIARIGVPVRPWRLSASPGPALPGELVLDAVGRDLWHEPATPGPGEPALLLDAPAGFVETFVIAGARVLAVRFPNAATWASGDGTLAEPLPTLNTAGAAIARQAADACGLSFAAVTVVRDGEEPHVLYADAAPDPLRWDAALDGALLPALADHLVQTATRSQGVPA